LSGGSGIDTVSYENALDQVVVNLFDPTQNVGDAAGDTYFDVEQFRLSRFVDLFVGADGNDVVFGWGGGGLLIGNSGADELNGDDGNDRLSGGAGADILNGGDEFDTVFYGDAPGPVGVNRVDPTQNFGDAKGDVYIGIEAFSLSQNSDVFVGADGSEAVSG